MFVETLSELIAILIVLNAILFFYLTNCNG